MAPDKQTVLDGLCLKMLFDKLVVVTLLCQACVLQLLRAPQSWTSATKLAPASALGGSLGLIWFWAAMCLT